MLYFRESYCRYEKELSIIIHISEYYREREGISVSHGLGQFITVEGNHTKRSMKELQVLTEELTEQKALELYNSKTEVYKRG